MPGHANTVSVTTAPPSRRAELEPGDGHDRDRRVLERVLGHHPRLRHALGPRGADVVGPQDLQHRGAGQPRDRGHREGAQGERGQHEVAPVAAPGGREESALSDRSRMNRMPRKKVGADLPDQGQAHRRRGRRGCSRRIGGEEADRHRDHRGQHEGGEPQLEGRGQVAAHHVEGGLAEVDRAAEVAVGEVARKITYCTGSGLSRPSSRRTRRISLVGASGGSRSGTGSPDRRMTTKTTVETSQSAMRARKRR